LFSGSSDLSIKSFNPAGAVTWHAAGAHEYVVVVVVVAEPRAVHHTQ
jgi:hypothetical protein